MKDEIRKMAEIKMMNEIFEGVITKDAFEYTRTTFFKTKTSESWRGRVDLSRSFYKEEKEALNAMAFCFLLVKEQEEKGHEVNWNACIAYVIQRLIRKSLMWDMKPGNKKKFLKLMKDFLQSVDNYVHETLLQQTGEKFTNAIYELAAQISPEEKMLYEVAKHYTDLVEYKFIKDTIWFADRNRIGRELKDELERYKVDDYIGEDLGKLISYLSWSRNINRWQGCGPTLNCNILCHMFETAIFGWFMAIELNQKEPGSNISPSQAFLVGLFHDVSELWTDDIPTPCKDYIKGEYDKTLRPLTEQLEREALEENFYKALPEKVSKYFKENIMLEDLSDEEFHKFLKKADYFSADCEVYWMIYQGSNNRLFFDILKRSIKEKKRTPQIHKLLKKMYIMSLLHIPREP